MRRKTKTSFFSIDALVWWMRCYDDDDDESPWTTPLVFQLCSIIDTVIRQLMERLTKCLLASCRSINN